MTDVHDRATRSYNMSRIQAKNTKPELIVRSFLHSKGLRFRLHVSSLPGKPDIVLPKFKTVIQVHGCFWHKHVGCSYFIIPRTKSQWWIKKLDKTAQRDKENLAKLSEAGWKTIIIWECELKQKVRQESLQRLYIDVISAGI